MAGRRLTAMAAVFVGLSASPVSAAGGGGGGGGGACPGFGSGSAIELRDNCFAPTAHLSASGEVTVRNAGNLVHDLTAVDGGFSTGSIRPGEEVKLTVPGGGPFRVYCTLHGNANGQGMAGVLFVDGTQPAASPAALADDGGGRGLGSVVALTAAAAVVVILLGRRGVAK